MKCISTEGKVAVFTSEDLYKVHAVTVVPTVKSLKSNNERNDRSGQGYYEKKGKQFSELLDKAMNNSIVDSDIEIKANGYTKDAQSFYVMYRSHTYS